MRLIQLRGKYAVGEHRFAIVDDDVFEVLNEYKWKAKPNQNGNVYATRNVFDGAKYRSIRMHRVVLEYDGPLDIDHINHNSLDNRAANLRIVTRSANVRNRVEPTLRIVRAVCAHCGEVFEYATTSAKDRSFCSTRCSHAFRREPLAPKPCDNCGHVYMPVKTNQRFCCERCNWKFKNDRKPRTTGKRWGQGESKAFKSAQKRRERLSA